MRGILAIAVVCVASAYAGVAPAETVDPLATDATPDHPLRPVLRLAVEGRERLLREIDDYTCRIIRRERLRGELRPHDFIQAKIRHASRESGAARPFSVYLKFTSPAAVAGREVLFVEGRNAGKLLVRRGGQRLAYVTTYLDPNSPLALEDNRYPVTDIGFVRLIDKLTRIIRADMRHYEVDVRFFENAKIGDRPCTRIVVEHPTRRDYFSYYRAVVFIDKKLNLPTAYAAYDWPAEPGGEPRLFEEYIYDDIKLNPGLTDADFDRANPDYLFLRRRDDATP